MFHNCTQPLYLKYVSFNNDTFYIFTFDSYGYILLKIVKNHSSSFVCFSIKNLGLFFVSKYIFPTYMPITPIDSSKIPPTHHKETVIVVESLFRCLIK